MLKRRLIPCLDVRDGRVVKGIQFESLRDSGDPVSLAKIYEDQGADELVMLDVSATVEGRLALLKTVEAIRQVLSIPLLVGGGVRSVEDARALLRSGADKVGVNSAAIQRPPLVEEISAEFGAQCCVVAIDARRCVVDSAAPTSWRIFTHGGRQATEQDALEWGREVQQLGAGEILLTSMDRDGTGVGFDCPLLRDFTKTVSIPVIASGGASQISHFVEAFAAGAHAVLAASIFHDQKMSVAQVKQELVREGVRLRI